MNRQAPITTNEMVVAFLLKEAGDANMGGLTPLQINKLVYLCHGWTLGFFGDPLIENRNGNIQAWQYGPVVVDVYHKLKHFERAPVTFDAFCFHLTNTAFSLFRTSMLRKLDSFEQEHPKIYELLKDVYDYHKEYSASRLILLTHQENTPWHQCYIHNKKGSPIPDGVIKTYYKNMVDE